MLRVRKAVAIIACMGAMSPVGGYGDALARGGSAVIIGRGAAIGGLSIRPRYWGRGYRPWVGFWQPSWVGSSQPNLVPARRNSGVPESMPDQPFGSCWIWRATHTGIQRVWSCYYVH
jgi:hypothetical protein